MRARRSEVGAVVGFGLLLVCSVLIAGGAAARPSGQVPASRHGFPDWLRGPFQGLGFDGLTSHRFALLLLGVTVGYLAVLACAGAVRPRWAIAAIVAVHAAFLLAPPLLSGDVFSYLEYARVGTVHGLNPYADAPTRIAGDLAYRFASEHRITSPYGPLWTLVSDASTPFGVQAGMWALKALAALASLGIVALVWRGVRRAGKRSCGDFSRGEAVPTVSTCKNRAGVLSRAPDLTEDELRQERSPEERHRNAQKRPNQVVFREALRL